MAIKKIIKKYKIIIDIMIIYVILRLTKFTSSLLVKTTSGVKGFNSGFSISTSPFLKAKVW